MATGLKADTLPLDQERYWITKEELSYGVDKCRDGRCPRHSEFTTRLFNPQEEAQMRRLMSLLDFQAAAEGRPLEHPETPQFCAQQMPSPDQVIWNPEWMQMSDKLEALRGLQGLYVDVSELKAPEGYQGEFGAELQKEVERRFEAAGIRMVTKEEVERIPGQPKLSVFFSATDPDTGCWWSVFSTLTQTAILTRDINVKLNVGTWAFMKGFDPDQLDATEYEAIVEVFDKFVEDFVAANDPDFEPVNIPPYVAIDGTPMTAPEVYVKSYDDILADEGPVPTADENAGEETNEPEFTPAAMKPELTPKALRRLRLDQYLEETGNADALEKLTTAGEGQ